MASCIMVLIFTSRTLLHFFHNLPLACDASDALR
jgi:hypothetical protein